MPEAQTKASSSPQEARPVLKWAGGKSRLLPDILELLPASIDTYYEPFVGGAAVFFALANRKRFKKAVLTDRNPELVNVYKALKRDVDGVIRSLKAHVKRGHSEKAYYEIRGLDPADLTNSERAARLIYLNKTGYNGLYRVNRKGLFNVPFGRYKQPNICDEARLRAASSALKGVSLLERDFETACKKATKGDAVYFDPPYLPVSRTSNFTAYHDNGFGKEEHERLARVFAELAARNVTAVLSNSYTPFAQQLYKGFVCREVRVSRPINSKTQGRGEVAELLAVNLRASRRARAR